MVRNAFTKKSAGRNNNRRGARRQAGTTSVEFAIVGSLFFMLLFSIMDFALVGYVKLTMQNAIREGARYAITGRTDLDPDESGNRRAAVESQIRASSIGLLDRVTDITAVRVTNSQGTAVTGFGNAGEIVVITLDCEWPILNPFLAAISNKDNYQFSVSATMKNENF